AGAAALELGGYDYHDGTRTSGDAKDLQAGMTVGRILMTAEILKKRLFLYVTSDGAVVSPKSEDRDAPWRTDRGMAGASYTIYFDPSGKRPASKTQLGHFIEGQAASDQTLIGNN